MRMLATLFAALLMAAPALAADKPPAWTGCHIAAHVGYSIAEHDTTLAVPGFAGVNLDSLSASGAGLGGGVGCDLRLSNAPIVVGAWADWSWRDLEQSNTLTLGGFTAGTRYAVEDAWAVGARAGVLINDATLLYALAGYTEARTSSLTVTAGGGGGSIGMPDLSGWLVGGGLETQLGSGWALRAEYRYARYDGETVALIPGALNLDLDTSEHTARIGAIWRLSILE